MLTPLDDGSVVGVSNSGTMFLMKDDMLLDTISNPESGTDFRSAAKCGDILYVGRVREYELRHGITEQSSA